MCQEKPWYNNALVSNWGRNWISALRLLLHTHPQKFKLKWIKESNVQNKVLTPLEKYKWKYIYASGFPKAANGYSMWWLIQQSKLKAVRLLSSSLLSAVTELSRIWSFDLRCEAVFCFVLIWFDCEILMEKCDDLESSSTQEATRQMGLWVGDKTMNALLVGTPVLVQQGLQISLKKNQ